MKIFIKQFNHRCICYTCLFVFNLIILLTFQKFININTKRRTVIIRSAKHLIENSIHFLHCKVLVTFLRNCVTTNLYHISFMSSFYSRNLLNLINMPFKPYIIFLNCDTKLILELEGFNGLINSV